MIPWVWKSTETWRRSARSKLPARIGSVIDRRSLNASYTDFWASLLHRDDHENDRRSSRRCISKYSQSSPQVRKSLVLCKEKRLRDKVGVVLIIDTRANCIAKKERQKGERKCSNLALKTKHQKRGNFVTFLCMERVPEWITVRGQDRPVTAARDRAVAHDHRFYDGSAGRCFFVCLFCFIVILPGKPQQT